MEASGEHSVRDKLNDAISKIINEEGASFISKWIALVEVIDENGEKSLWSMSSEDLAPWDKIGMIEFHNRGLQPEQEE
jgi:hypothetical protein